MSPCNILFLTSLKPINRFASNFVWMFLGRTLTKFVIIGVLHLFHGIMGNFVQFICQFLDLFL